MKASLLVAAVSGLFAANTLACPDHDYHMENHLRKRMEADSGADSAKWVYEESNRWGYLSDDWHPAVTHRQQNETVYLRGWHIHAPADHTVEGHRSRAELHMVHVDAKGKPRAVLAIRIDPGSCNSRSRFFEDLPELTHCKDTKTARDVKKFLPKSILAEVGWFREFWTYKGSLTSPPCSEGIRWFVARNVLYVGDKQMQDILYHSKFSSRETQEIWAHQVNV
ncbi:hypothetical protein DRE_04381 [Drechslerella stenobrocha 248]|uniref:Alpha-carbonic anhydrase domain-containing protein n=1 Tax=Drechslerella stenobrocha 248 TaxID=1043628 RepID=W7I281_9PEZI|nr:hypothetical protein DRE_04381 [Drechslerella stenobrocha 248]